MESNKMESNKMELISIIKCGILQCEERHKQRLKQENKTPIQRYSHIYKFGLFVSSALKGINRELLLFIPITENTPCFVTEKEGENLNLKEIFEQEIYEKMRKDLNNFKSYYSNIASIFNDKFAIFEYNNYKRQKCEITKIIGRILNYTTSTKYQKVKMIIKKFAIPEFYKSLLLPEGYLLIFLLDEIKNDQIIKDSVLSKNNTIVYNEYIKSYIEGNDLSDKILNQEKMPGTPENRVFIGGNYDFMATLNDIKAIVTNNGFVPILAHDLTVENDNIHDDDISLLSKCKYSIFEVTDPEGALMEIERVKDFKIHTLLLYQVRDSSNRNMPKHISKMLSTLKLKQELLEKIGYNQTNELYSIIKDWLEKIKKNTFRYL